MEKKSDGKGRGGTGSPVHRNTPRDFLVSSTRTTDSRTLDVDLPR